MKKAIMCFLLFSVILFTGCEANVLPDTYVAESDYQYKQYPDLSFQTVQQTDGITYLFHDSYLYYLEEGKDIIMPLCNKADCLHDKETDVGKQKECNAYVPETTNSQEYCGIAICNGYLYCLNPPLTTHTQTLYRFALDGTARESVYTWNGKENIVWEWLIHRDVFYYGEQRYYLENDEVQKEYSIKSLALTGINRQPKTIYTADKDLSVITLGSPQAYGNYFYFEIISTKKDDGNKITEENQYDRLYNKTFVYNIQTDELCVLDIPELPVTSTITGVQFWQDKIIIDPYNNEKEGNAPETVYIANLDGSDPQILFENVPQASYFLSDGKYLYHFDDWMPDIDDWLSNPGLYTVYDQELNIVDSFTVPIMPDGRPDRLPVGETDRMYHIYEDIEKNTWSVMRWDKESIGSYQGKTISLTEITYQ